jgi:anti-sigma28 factor (negative regulator of flagellin synthesis)
MSIRIDNDQLTAAAGAQAGKTDQVGATGTRSLFGPAAQSTGKDSVEMSSIAASLISAGSAQDLDHAQRVSQLAAAYASGSYQVDSLNTSRAIVGRAIQSAPEGEFE